MPLVHIKEPLRTDSDIERLILGTAGRITAATKTTISDTEAEKIIGQAVSKTTYSVSDSKGFSIDKKGGGFKFSSHWVVICGCFQCCLCCCHFINT